MMTSSSPVKTERIKSEHQNNAQGPKVFQILAGGPWGGAAVVVLALTRALIDAGCEVWVLCQSDIVAQRFSEAGAHVVRCETWLRELHPVYDLRSFWYLFRLCRRERFDLVVTHTSKGGFLGRLSSRLAGVPRIIHTAHGFAWHEFSSTAANLFYTALEWFAAKFCDLIICVNNEDRLAAINRRVVPSDKIVTVVNGIDLDRFAVDCSRHLRRQLAGPEDAVLIGAVGRLAPMKGVEYLIHAMPAILNQHKNCKLVLIGDGTMEDEFRAMARSIGVADRCEFLGFRSDIPELLACLDVFVQPSLREAMSVTLLEGMAAAKPVLASAIKGNREVVTDGVDGLLVTPADSEALSKAAIELIKNPERAQALGARARDTIKQRFSQDAMVKNTLQLYELPLGDQTPQVDQPALAKTQPDSIAGHRV
jgi:glycosyltransferase involved in cell wall biosynthesis